MRNKKSSNMLKDSPFIKEIVAMPLMIWVLPLLYNILLGSMDFVAAGEPILGLISTAFIMVLLIHCLVFFLFNKRMIYEYDQPIYLNKRRGRDGRGIILNLLKYNRTPNTNKLKIPNIAFIQLQNYLILIYILCFIIGYTISLSYFIGYSGIFIGIFYGLLFYFIWLVYSVIDKRSKESLLKAQRNIGLR